MIEITVPGFGELQLEHLVLDYNGTLAIDGALIAGVADCLRTLAARLTIHVITADTFGKVKTALADLPVKVIILPPGQQDTGKLNYVQQLGLDRAVCIGNGRNDRLMLQAARLGIAVLQAEGAAAATVAAADVLAPDILSAFNLLTNPLRLTATLRA